MVFERLNTTRQRTRRAMSADMVSLLEDQCTISSISGLLRDAKARIAGDGVRITAKSKEELISENLRRAVASGAVSLADVENMLLESEENGRQVVLFYELVDADARRVIGNPEIVAERLFGKGWQKKRQFPLFREKPKGDVWSDFRVEDGGWVAKLYRGDSRWQLDRKESKETENRRVRVWVRRYARDVFLFRWHANGIFEIRAPRVDGKRELREIGEIAWGAMRDIVTLAAFRQHKLTAAAAFLAHDETRLDGEVAFGPARLAAPSGGQASLTPPSSECYLHDSEEHKQTLRLFKICDELAVYWLRPSDDDDDQDRVKTIVGYQGFKNSILIPGRVGSANANYVTHRLLQIEAEQRGRGRRNGSAG